MKTEALLDSNVLVALVVEAHEHHAASFALFDSKAGRFAIAAHSYAETYSTLTRQGERAPCRFTPQEAWAALESLRAVTDLVGLTPAQTFDAIRTYAAAGGIGARLYDRLIGQTAVVHGLPMIVTWNVGHMRGLFPALQVNTPTEFLAVRC